VHRSRGAVSPEPFGDARSGNPRAARDVVGPENPRASVRRRTEAIRIGIPQVRPFSNVPRAVFEACSARPPVAQFSIHRCWAAATAWPLARRYGSRHQGPGDAICRAGTVQLGPPRRGVRLAPLDCHTSATASRSRLATPREAPSDGPTCREYESGKTDRG
jgi:hypothetical protein